MKTKNSDVSLFTPLKQDKGIIENLKDLGFLSYLYLLRMRRSKEREDLSK